MDSLENLFTDTAHQEMDPGIPSGVYAVGWDEDGFVRAEEEGSIYRFD